MKYIAANLNEAVDKPANLYILKVRQTMYCKNICTFIY